MHGRGRISPFKFHEGADAEGCSSESAGRIRDGRLLTHEDAPDGVYTGDAHRVNGATEQVFVPCSGRDRGETLCEVLRGDLDQKTIIFTNDVDTCRSVVKNLATRGL